MIIEANGILMGYDLTGKPDGPVITLSHSLATTREMWWPQLGALEENYRILRYDTRGHGETQAPEGDYTLETLAQDLFGVLDGLNIEKTHYVGLSMGGMVGQIAALAEPDRFVTLALCDTSSQIPSTVHPTWEERIDLARTGGMAPPCGGVAQKQCRRYLILFILGTLEGVRLE